MNIRGFWATACFLAGAVLAASAGAYIDCFVLQLDEETLRQLGDGPFAFPVVLLARLAMAGIGSAVFGVAVSLMMIRGRLTVGRSLAAVGGALLLGMVHAAGSFVIIKLDMALGRGTTFVLLWVYALLMPVAAARLVLRRAPQR